MKKFLTPLIFFLSFTAYGQLNPMGTMYYQNQYLSNPAMAGLEQGWEANAAYKAQWTAVEGAPSIQAVTATFGAANRKVGAGMALYNEQAGVIQRTNVKGTYAYHLPLNNGSAYLDFGLSAGIMNEWIDFGKVRGDDGDMSLTNFNQRKMYFDGDFGLAFRNEHLNIQAALPNMKRFFNRDLSRTIVDRSTYFASASYKFISPNRVMNVIEPKVTYRGIDNYRDIFDLGLNTQFWGDKLLLSGIYHSTASVTFGAGTTYQNKFSILLLYTTNASDLQNYANGEFEIGLRYNFR
ncbi:PorP/SprF family type IX secretion system membrane protein [Pedobacter endophyticus]|uniref:PorP/SprF family type IX secretion system membrane protein n=1 Tax=Pedobacter endophyticus TaxID=2789740 RepID=A0A7U3Q3G6_9SPHI|nr:PorP/SprF family type IX secretion system membrane protein [Pedobacter endophyticus]QPH37831.1 PorP/SprF family type IX secretion system membrane protein [Pedobacter endophyticus]